MKPNVGNLDRMIRGLAGVALLVVGFIGGLEAPLNYVAMGVGAVFTLTALIKFCPLYPILGINTCSKQD